jgi:hypothetical protein
MFPNPNQYVQVLANHNPTTQVHQFLPLHNVTVAVHNYPVVVMLVLHHFPTVAFAGRSLEIWCCSIYNGDGLCINILSLFSSVAVQIRVIIVFIWTTTRRYSIIWLIVNCTTPLSVAAAEPVLDDQLDWVIESDIWGQCTGGKQQPLVWTWLLQNNALALWICNCYSIITWCCITQIFNGSKSIRSRPTVGIWTSPVAIRSIKLKAYRSL